ncbi:TetR/AcrR family transcriptional regulator [Rhodococcus opacus]|uniref:TetR/AcrR family transcriptional regulator n=1 Tax=Rhodococcus opacus TaxID=37919 RepID=UPI0027E04D24|nr:TetR/AcrR family transcriptional regulator [Rhodococcus opacus]
MTDASLTRTARKAAATRRVIVDAAEAILFDGGQGALTLEAVAERADVAVQTVYNRVGGRSALLIAVAERALEENREYMERALAGEGSTEERLLASFRTYARFAAERPMQFRLLADPPDEPAALEAIAALIEDRNRCCAEVVAAGVADGSFDPGLDPHLTSIALWGVSNGILGLQWRADRLRVDEAELDRLMDTVSTLIVTGLRRRA